MDLWGDFSKWEVINYDGAFFRAEGTNADAFIEESGVLSKQESQNKAHSHGMDDAGSHQHDRGDMEITGKIAGAPCSSGYFKPNYAEGAFSKVGWGWGKTEGVGWNNNTSLLADFVASRTWTGNTSENGSHSHTVHNDGGSESRPENYTIRIWKEPLRQCVSIHGLYSSLGDFHYRR